MPLLQALAVAQLAVADGQDGAEFSLEAFHHLRREGDLGDEENDAFAFSQIAADDGDIHFRLAAAGDAEKQLHVEGTVSGSDAFDGGLLFLCKGYRFGRGLRIILEKGAFHLFRIDGYDFLFLQGMEHGIGYLVADPGDRKILAGMNEDELQSLFLPGRKGIQVRSRIQQFEVIDGLGFVAGTQFAADLQQAFTGRGFDQMQNWLAFHFFAQIRNAAHVAIGQFRSQKPVLIGDGSAHPFHFRLDIRDQPGWQHGETGAAHRCLIVSSHPLCQFQQGFRQHRFRVQHL